MSGVPEWRYFPELLRRLERVPEGPSCSLCRGATEAMRGPRATLAWCPRCRLLAIAEAGGGRILGVFSAAAMEATADGAGMAAAPSPEPSEVPRFRASAARGPR